ncbi:hypothetical protein FOA52_011941 [Chlamydomonas sp. UWO 241]|nr:hypothetical protein FOA52_011941 [Chlamydomonas sp. UWO 241]
MKTSSIIAAALLFAAIAGGVQGDASIDGPGLGRALQQSQSGYDFPFHRCDDYANASLPYNLSPPVEKSPGLYCTVLTYLGPKPNPSVCYTQLSSLFSTITIGVREECVSDWNKRAGVFFDGKLVGTSTDWYTYSSGSIIKVFSLSMSTANTGTELCIKSAAVTCPTMAQFFQPQFGPEPRFPLQYAVCDICTEFCVFVGGVTGPGIPPAPTAGTCELMAQFSEETSPRGMLVDFTCTALVSPPSYSCVKACGTGSLETNDMCAEISGTPLFVALYDAIGYGAFSCNINASTYTTCYPGNSALNGGIDLGYGITKTPFELEIVSNNGRDIDIRIDAGACNANGIPRGCCNMDLWKIEIVISDAKCRFTDISIDGVYKAPSYAVNYLPSDESATGHPVFKLTTLSADPIAKIGSIIHLRAASECPSIAEIFPSGKLQYAYFSNRNTNFACCGTESLPL